MKPTPGVPDDSRCQIFFQQDTHFKSYPRYFKISGSLLVGMVSSNSVKFFLKVYYTTNNLPSLEH